MESPARTGQNASAGQDDSDRLGRYRPVGARGSLPAVQAFGRRLIACRQGQWTTDFQRLEAHGLTLPAPEDMNDEDLSAKLWEVIDGLARLRTYLMHTDHLTDRQLYRQLWREALHEQVPDVPLARPIACHLDMLGGGAEQDLGLWLRYYADASERQLWQADLAPGQPLPDHETPPCDRDRLLPRP